MMEKQTKGRGSEVLQRQITLNKGVVRLFWAYGREYSWQLDTSQCKELRDFSVISVFCDNVTIS